MARAQAWQRNGSESFTCLRGKINFQARDRVQEILVRDKFAPMKPGRLGIGALLVCTASAFAADAASITIPSISDALSIDGKLDDPGWQGARVLPLASTEFGSPLIGGETRIATRGAYLCLGARIPESGRVVAHARDRNPKWWSEDLITWTLHVHSTALRRSLNVSLTVNPLGAYRFQNATTGEPFEGAEKVLVATSLGPGEWVVEAAIPLDRLAQTGFIDV